MPAPPPLPRLARGRGRGGGIMRVQTQRLQFLAHAGLAQALGCEPGGDTRDPPDRMARAARHLAGLAERLDNAEAGGGKRGDAYRSVGCNKRAEAGTVWKESVQCFR